MNIVNDLITKLLETPETVNQLRKYFVNRDLAIEIDGKKYQLMTKRDEDEFTKLQNEIKDLKSRLYDLDGALKNVLDVTKRKVTGPEFNQAIEHADRLLGN